uniref:F-box protein 40, tandem duplicate 1 n=1 Tax=Cyprinus carpio TaxID=7962 RepID=A0A8C2AAB4_CYPCA
MGRLKTQTSKLHRHCESCHSRRCKTPIEISVSCAIMSCRLLCGAVFHLCKEEEHMLLCPNDRVPCLNVEYGCPFIMCRSNLAKHLTVCPASVVSCSMEWNRWPIEESETPEFYENILKENYTQEPLDLSMALRDQQHLFHSLKMKTLFPELIEKVAEEPSEGAVGGVPLANGIDEASASSSAEMEEDELTQEEREELARNPTVVNLESYNIWEKMFSMELSGCKHTIKSIGQNPETSRKEIKPQANPSRLEVLQEELPTKNENLDAATDIPQYNACEMDEDKFLIASSLFACDTRPRKKLVYQHLEPMKIKTVRTFKVPTSFKAKQSRIRNPSHNKKVNSSVDTSDLGVEMDDIPKWDEVQATLLCSLERELRGHLIAESRSTDALLVDIGTQTYDFYLAPFKAETSLANITADRALKLHVQIQAESVTRRHNKSSSAFTYLCNHIFRRDEFHSHYKNVHSDIQSCVSGWFEQRCPLAYLGCTFIQRRFQPSSHRAIVFYDRELSTFCLRPEVSDTLYEGIKPVTVERKRARNTDALSRLPFEVLVHVAGFLDSFTLSQLALVSRLMREVCRTLLHDRGMVSLKWEKKIYSHSGWCWRARKRVWQFSNLFSTVDSWCFDKLPPISEHLKITKEDILKNVGNQTILITIDLIIVHIKLIIICSLFFNPILPPTIRNRSVKFTAGH